MKISLGAVVCLLIPGMALAEKISVAPFKGPGADVVRTQISSGLCDSGAATCVPPAKVTKAGKPDWAKAKKEKIDWFVTGTVKAKGAKHTLELQVMGKPGAPKLKKSFAFTGTELPDKTLEQALGALTKAMGLEAPAPAEPKEEPKKEPEPKEEPKKEPEAKKEPEPKEDPKKKEPEEPPPPPKEADRDAPPKEAEPDSPSKPIKPPIVAIEAGVDLFSRNFSYNQPGTLNLRSYSAALIVAPAFRLEVYPLALVTKGALAGLGIDGTFAIAVGLKSRRSGTDVTWPTNLSHFDVSLRFRIRPVDSVDAAIIPFVGFASRSFSVGKGTDGSELDGLPAISYSAIRPGLAGELPFSNSGFLIFAKFAALIVLSSGPIIGPNYFTKGSNFGIEGQLGAGYRIAGPVSIRLAFDFARFGLGFSSEPTDTYQAVGAVDTYLGGNLALRLTF